MTGKVVLLTPLFTDRPRFFDRRTGMPILEDEPDEVSVLCL